MFLNEMYKSDNVPYTLPMRALAPAGPNALLIIYVMLILFLIMLSVYIMYAGMYVHGVCS